MPVYFEVGSRKRKRREGNGWIVRQVHADHCCLSEKDGRMKRS